VTNPIASTLVEWEISRTFFKFGRDNLRGQTPEQCLAILTEEFLELAQVVNDLRDASKDIDSWRLGAELTQVAAVAMNWLGTIVPNNLDLPDAEFIRARTVSAHLLECQDWRSGGFDLILGLMPHNKALLIGINNAHWAALCYALKHPLDLSIPEEAFDDHQD